ncbi:50S ribosomal protein L11 [Picrophilus oshimae]|uniref:Large ribosomal subunit protein uL11 n=2 Tax=Picrophilus torridus (strain ATCC 700027 / DSM 9790 / JCM 10055 / NBRC 100828 / KAW 2/3) TaxID=1122961 RepID=RL11_PICTO|nr:50S ribosomal protein L11 [Picrophilus oshimae]Q6L1Y0.1 RecName: Full=Large ribosomal subunit protein uL11; AltName: Full=50S ribosomal protein L11 [Picrophilus oshimae DSM 9789]AAT43022.1 large subunit ribosomal protein L11P [Picrophilus oshimae DSM 9789]SMD30676.1 LSU ribosomal protein L11P [Picrophilus oshimae DSM 9789]
MVAVKTMVEGGKATTGPPLGPALGPLGLNLGQVVKDINEKTKNFAGMQVPVTVNVIDPATKKYEIIVGVPPTSALLKKELGIEKGASKKKEKIAGNATLEQIKKVAESKRSALLSYNMKGAVLEVLGSAVSLGITVDGRDPKEVQKMIKNGEIEI